MTCHPPPIADIPNLQLNALRDDRWESFAAVAMGSFIRELGFELKDEGESVPQYEKLAEFSCKMADAMMAELKARGVVR